MARNKIYLSQIINDYLMVRDDLDYDSMVSKPKVTLLAKNVLREVQKSVGGTLKSVRIPIENNLYAELPSDYFTYSKIGVLDTQTNTVKVLGRNDEINISGDYMYDGMNNKIVDADGIEQLTETPASSSLSDSDWQSNYFNFFLNYGAGNLFGVPAGQNRHGYYRVNTTDNRIELSGVTNSDGYIILEYVSDATMATDPLVDQRLEDLIKSGIFYKSIERKSNIPFNAKVIAKKEYNNEKRKARKQLKSFTLEEAVSASRKGNKQSPKF